MDCPRCGTPNEPGDRFCSSCGASLGEAASKPQRSLRERIGGLFGKDRRTRVVSAATIVALIVAVVAFVALGQSKEKTIPRDAYTIAAEQMCITAKRHIVAVENGGLASGAAAARQLLPLVSEWRSEFDALKVPSDRVAEAQALDAALKEVQLRIATLARVAASGNRKQILEQAKAADEASSSVEEAVAALGLSHCSSLTIGFSNK